MKVWFDVFLPLIYSFHSFSPHSVIKLGNLSRLFILTLLMSKPTILQSFICISSVGVFLYPSDLITDMIVHPSVTILLRLNALYPLPLIFPFWIFCVLLFLRACCCVLSRSESAMHWHCLALAGGALTRGMDALAQRGSEPCFPSPARPGHSHPRCHGTRGEQTTGVAGGVPVQGPESWLGWLWDLPPPFLSWLCS